MIDGWTTRSRRDRATDLCWRNSELPGALHDAINTVNAFSSRYLTERGLRPNTVRGYRQLLVTRILPYFGEARLADVTLSEVKAWRATLPEDTEATNAAAYRLLRSILQAAEEEQLIDRPPPKIRGAGRPR